MRISHLGIRSEVGISIACSGAAGAHAIVTGKTARSWGVSIVSHTDAHFPKLAHALGMILVKPVVLALLGTSALPPTVMLCCPQSRPAACIVFSLEPCWLNSSPVRKSTDVLARRQPALRTRWYTEKGARYRVCTRCPSCRSYCPVLLHSVWLLLRVERVLRESEALGFDI